MQTEEKNLLIMQIQTDVSLISVLSLVSIFFIGALIPQFSAYDLSVKIPISFLIISTFAFLMSALILSNATQKVREGSVERTEKHISWGYSICEYLGITLLVLSVPLAMSIVTDDIYIRVVTFIVAIVGIAVYQFMGFSYLDEHFSKNHKLFAFLTLLLGIMLFVSQTTNMYFTELSVVFLIFMGLMTVFAPNRSVQ